MSVQSYITFLLTMAYNSVSLAGLNRDHDGAAHQNLAARPPEATDFGGRKRGTQTQPNPLTLNLYG